jgi:hypothetical protein
MQRTSHHEVQSSELINQIKILPVLSAILWICDENCDIECVISEIVKLAKGENDTQLSKMTQSEQDTYEMHVRAANIVSCIGMNSGQSYYVYWLKFYTITAVVMSDHSQI